MPEEYENYNEAVRNLQRYLRQLSYFEETIPDVPIDGIFDEQTAEALRSYQRMRGLPVTGSATHDTWDELYADYRASLAQSSPPRHIAVFPIEPYTHTLAEGDIGFPVTAVQYMLRELHQVYRDLGDVEVTGIYNAETARAVRIFQRKNRLRETGLVDPLTWNAIADQYNTLFGRLRTE